MKAIERKIRSNLCLSLVLLAGLVVGLVSSANAITYREDFEVGYFNGAELQYHRGWFQTRSSPLTDIGNNNGVAGSYGLTSGNQSFTWIDHPFSWKELIVDDYIVLQMDFQTDGSAHFDDDRIGWITKDDDSDSDNIFGVQLDPKSGGGYNIETYWENINDGDSRMTIATLPTLSANSWYRFEAKISKVSESPVNSAKVEVKLWSLDGNGDIDELKASGTINNTASLADSYKPNTRYFTEATIWPVFKNYSSTSGSADNAYFHIEDGFDDVAEVEVTDDSATEGGGTGQFRLKLESQPTSNVEITCDPYINDGDIDLGSGAGVSVTKTFTNSNWSTWQNVTVTAYNDDETESSEVAWIDFSISSNDDDFDGHNAGPLPVRIKIEDNDNDDQSAALVAGPYLMYTNEDGKMMVLWILDSSPTCTLEWDEDEDFTLPLTGSDDNISYNNSGTHGYQYRYTISSLSTSTKYYYRLTYSSGGKSYKYTGSFSTAPASSATDVKFLAYGDTRGNGGAPAYGHDTVCSGIMDTVTIDPGYQSFLLQAGDWVENGNNDTDWEDNYFNRDFPNARSMLANLPVMGCTGNHEFSGTSTIFPDYWPYDDIYWPGATKHMYYYFEYGPIRVVVADQYAYGNYSQQTNRFGYDGTYPYDFANNVQLNWIKDTLSGSSKTWNFLLLHQPLYPAGGHSLANFHPLVDEMEELFETGGDWDITDDVDIVFCGHNHFYARCLEDGVRHIITGGGGAPLRDPEDPPGTQNNVEESSETFHFCEVYIRDKVLRCRARSATGSKIETFTLLQDGTHYYVKPDGSNGSNGQSWDTAFQTISYAISQAQNGDLIEVAEGTYEESIDFAGKSIVVTSTDPEDSSVVTSTIIDANRDVNNTGRVVTFDDSEGTGSVLTGFTITGGYAPGTGNARDGGGIFCYGSSPSISNCFITGNYAGDDGGGIYCDNESEATISNCTVYANEAGDRGGGMYCRNSDSTIQDCDVSSNKAYMGGGLYYTVSEPMVKDCTISENSATGIGDDPDGGGIHCDSSDGTITNCIITNNNADDDGGGIFCDSGSEPEIINCTISGNEAGDKGGGMYCRNSDSTIKDSDVISNDAPIGGGLYYTSSDPLIDGCTISENSSTGSGISADGGGIYLLSSDANIIGSVISDNSTNDDGGGIFCDNGSEAVISDCTINGNDAGDKGGGMYCRDSNSIIKASDVNSNDAPMGGGLYYTSSEPLIERCIIMYNETTGGSSADGGGIYLLSSDANIISSVISYNISDDDAGGIYCLTDSDATITNCTLRGNDADDKGGGIYCKDGSDAVITNCIFWGNTATTGSQIHTASSNPVVTYSDVQGGWTGPGNIDSDPLFSDAYHLQSSSPCIDEGDPNGYYDGEKDIDGENRVMGDEVDMGADEYTQ